MLELNTLRKHREIRDIVNKLRVKYKSEPIMEFIETNYFYTADGVYKIMARVDKEPVQRPSLIYRLVMSEDFKL